MKLMEIHRREFLQRTGGALAGSQLGSLKTLAHAALGSLGSGGLQAAVAAYEQSGLDGETIWAAAGLPHQIPGYYKDGVVIPQNVIVGYLVELSRDDPDLFINTLACADGETMKGFQRNSGGVYSTLMQQLVQKMGMKAVLNNMMGQFNNWPMVTDSINNAMKVVPQLIPILAKVGITPANWEELAHSPQIFVRLEQLGIKIPQQLKQSLIQFNKRHINARQQELDHKRQKQNQERSQQRRQSSRPVRTDLGGGMHQNWDEFIESLRKQIHTTLI